VQAFNQLGFDLPITQPTSILNLDGSRQVGPKSLTRQNGLIAKTHIAATFALELRHPDPHLTNLRCQTTLIVSIPSKILAFLTLAFVTLDLGDFTL
jgi:hypothetical protein